MESRKKIINNPCECRAKKSRQKNWGRDGAGGGVMVVATLYEVDTVRAAKF